MVNYPVNWIWSGGTTVDTPYMQQRIVENLLHFAGTNVTDL